MRAILLTGRAFLFLLFGPGMLLAACGKEDGPESSSTPRVSGPEISLSSTEVDVGVMDQYETVVGTIQIENSGQEPLRITRVKPSCGCTVVELPLRTVEPGGSVDVTLEFSSGDTHGRVRRPVSVDSNDPKNPRVQFWVAADVEEANRPRIEVSPELWDAGALPQNAGASSTFTIKNTGKILLEVEAIDGFQGCQVKWTGRSRISQGEEMTFDVFFPPDHGFHPGAFEDSIRIRSNDPARPEVTVPVRAFVSGGLPSVRTRSLIWNYGYLEPGVGTIWEFPVTNLGDVDLHVRFLPTPDDPAWIHVDPEARWTIAPGEETTLPIAITKRAPLGFQQTSLAFETDDPFGPRISLLVMGFVGTPEFGLLESGDTLRLSKVIDRESGWFIGTVGSEERIIDRVLPIRNDLDVPLWIESVYVLGGRCDVSSTARIAPGEQLVLNLHLFPLGRIGIGRWRVEIQGRRGMAGIRRSFSIPLTGFLPRRSSKAELSALGWTLGNVESGFGLTKTVRISNGGTRPLKVEPIRLDDPITAGVVASPANGFALQPGSFQDVVLKLRRPSYQGTIMEALKIKTNDPMQREVTFPIQGHVSGVDLDLLPSGSRLLRLLYSSDETGHLAPCNCAEGRIGGFPRAAQAASAERERSAYLHAGDLFGEPQPHYRLRAESAGEILERMACQAMTLGETEFGFGRAFLDEFVSNAAFPVVCGNVFDIHSGDWVTGKPWVRLDQGEVRIGVLGVLGQDLLPENQARELQVRVEDPATIIASLTPAIREECDVVVLLAHMAPWRLKDLIAQGVPVDVIIAGHTEEQIIQPEVRGGVAWVQNGDRGKYLARLDVVLSGEGEVVWMEGEEIPLLEELGEDGEVLRILSSYREKLKTLPPPEPAPTGAATYVGVAVCAKCHREEHAIWQGSRHSRGLESFGSSGDEYDPECTQCHTTGYGKLNGFLRVDLTPEAGGVQCEACHGPGSAHVEEGRRFEAFLPSRCYSCHDPENSPHFQFEEYWPKIKHENTVKK